MILKSKRPRTLLGDVLEVKTGNGFKRYLQYIGFDKTDLGLGGDVVRIFKKKYKNETLPNIEEITKDEIDFYAHVHSVTRGIKEGLWSRVSNMKKDIGIQKPLFYQEGENDEWLLWQMNGDIWKTTKNEVLKSSADKGGVMPPKWVEERIITGKYLISDPSYIK